MADTDRINLAPGSPRPSGIAPGPGRARPREDAAGPTGPAPGTTGFDAPASEDAKAREIGAAGARMLAALLANGAGAGALDQNGSIPIPSTTGSSAPTTPLGSTAASGAPAARVYDGAQESSDGRARVASGEGADAASRNVQKGLDYYQKTFGRNGVDGAGRGVDVVINDPTTDSSGKRIFDGNGSWFTSPDGRGGEYEALRFGAGGETEHRGGQGVVRQREAFYSDDLTIHEITHGVIKAATGEAGGTRDEAGAVNEAVADVMAASATRDWRIGEGMYLTGSSARLLRDISRPDSAEAVHHLWTQASQATAAQRAGKEIEEHVASGIISTAAARAQQRIGGEAGWRAVERVFYRTITGKGFGDMSFKQTAEALRASSKDVLGAGSREAKIFDQELRRAGL